MKRPRIGTLQTKPPHKRLDESRSKKQPINRMPQGSLFYERIVPVLLIGMGILLAAMITVAAGILLGIIPFL